MQVAFWLANNGPATAVNFFITHLLTPWLDGQTYYFGHVFGNGMDIVNLIQQNDYVNKVTIIRKEAKKV
jgi:peptidylprolyl isomerase